ncbi:hypothetical protein MHY87_13685 [Microvirga sp. ACRRW]|uniref:hypothetical protein n=1 Tax=Microvirga sp. ACRRW TaxID=2918205 RepID=UPI001EF46DB2|nr:hypothetical protein [Microvirga sp. ACRRW]MCG7393957.1 hypothetical protein [Microvirga sp. ACRRW]
MKKILLSSVALLGLTSVAMAADLPNRSVAPVMPVVENTLSGFFITPQISTLGIGVEAGYRWDMFALRAGVNYYSLSRDFTAGGIRYQGDGTLLSVGLMADIFPFSNGFFLSGGLRLNGNNVEVQANPMGPVTIGNDVYTPAQIGQLNGKVDFNEVAPYLGLGWRGPVFGSKNVILSVEAGAMFQGDANTSLTCTGPACSMIGADLDAERRDIENKLDDLDIFPVVSIGLGVRF